MIITVIGEAVGLNQVLYFRVGNDRFTFIRTVDGAEHIVDQPYHEISQLLYAQKKHEEN